MKRWLSVAITATFVVALPTQAVAARFPRRIDPRSYELPEHMTWSDYHRLPGVDWKNPDNAPPKTLRAALILGDFPDQKFRVAEDTVDPTGQRGLGVADPAAYWVDVLFNNQDPSSPSHGHTVGEYWLEDSYGLVGVEAEGFGPYTMDGPMYQYGIGDFGTADDCPDDSGCNGDFDTELVQKSFSDVATANDQNGEFDFRFLLHAGYDESSVWLNYGLAKFADKEDVTEKFGPKGFPEHRNWATTRYVPWTSFFSAQQIWSHALPGTLATEGESDGGSVYAHEFSHILGVLDNYNNPYATNPDRAYAGPWDMMDRGSFNGPGGPFERYTIPPTQGATMGTHHMLRNKIRMGFIPPSEVFQVGRGTLDAQGVVRATILQRESPPDTTDPDLYSGVRVTLGTDRSSCNAAEPLCDGGGYDYYDMEVVNRQGFDSFTPDHGVLIAKSKSADASPFIWVIDAFPKDIGGTDYVTATGEKVPYTVGDYRQLADAAFHAGGAKGTKNLYFDEANGLAFYILEKKPLSDGRLTYDVAVQSLDSPVQPGDAEVKHKSGKLKKRITKQVFTVTNPGVNPGVYLLKVQKNGAKARLLNNLVYLDGGASQDVAVWTKKTRRGGSVDLTASPASASNSFVTTARAFR
ncbi:MAG TPA: immune inhibitor A domain-containing protein [Actinomycetota bacterium]|nr:immune inhibitor A domain-containing protein [Actinomycetota bacterium]